MNCSMPAKLLQEMLRLLYRLEVFMVVQNQTAYKPKFVAFSFACKAVLIILLATIAKLTNLTHFSRFCLHTNVFTFSQ